MNIGEMTKWILEHREGDAFIGWSEQEIVKALSVSANNNTLLYSTENGHLTGVMVMADLGNKQLHIAAALVKHKNMLCKFAERILEKFPSYKFTAKRRGNIVTYDLQRVVNLLRKRK